MEPIVSKKEQRKSALEIIGNSCVGIALVGLIGLIGASEPVCYYTTGFFLQYRYCEAGEKDILDIGIAVVLVTILILGFVLIRMGQRK